jgi:hypothetical protein
MATRDTVTEPRGRGVRETRGPTGWVIFGATLMLIIGFLNFFYGLAAIVNDQVVIVGGHGAIIADVTTWGWITLILSVVLVLTGFGLLAGVEAARFAAVVLLVLNAIEQVWIFPAAPLWAFLVILLDVIIIYNLTVRWSEPV